MEILYCDKDIVVCLKPVGLDSQQQIPSLIKENVGGEVYAVHRLDLNVGGLCNISYRIQIVNSEKQR